MKYLSISELRMDDKVIPLSSAPNESGKTFIVTDLHPTVRVSISSVGCTVTYLAPFAATLLEFDENHYAPGHDRYGKEHTSFTLMFQLIERRWEN